MWEYYREGQLLAVEEATLYGVRVRMSQLGADFAMSETETLRSASCIPHSI